jgi:hypothetical protein
MKPMNRFSLTITGFLTAVSIFSSPMIAAAFETPDPAWEKFTSARRVFQVQLCEMATRRWPEFASFFAGHRDLQLGYLERRNLVFYQLMSTNPSRIIRAEGGQKYLGFTWSEEEDRQFAKSIPGYSQVSADIAKLKKSTEKFKNRAALKDRFARLELDPEYLALMRETGKSIAEAERLLQQSIPAPEAVTEASPAPSAS